MFSEKYYAIVSVCHLVWRSSDMFRYKCEIIFKLCALHLCVVVELKSLNFVIYYKTSLKRSKWGRIWGCLQEEMCKK